MPTPNPRTLLAFVASSFVAVACTANTKPQHTFRFDESITVDGRERRYTLNLPPKYDQNRNVPLVIALHGGGGNSKQFEHSSLLTAKANAAGFAVVYPNGTAENALGLQTWNAGRCCGYASSNKIDDINFFRQLMLHLAAKYKLEPKKIFVTGHSNGGMMAYRLACELSEQVAAIAPNAAALMQNPCVPTRPVPVLHLHSAQDFNVPIAGGTGPLSGVQYPSLATSLETWASINQCQDKTETNAAQYTHTVWGNCKNRSGVELYLTTDGGHAWPGGLPSTAGGDRPATSIDANDLMLEFFSRHSLP